VNEKQLDALLLAAAEADRDRETPDRVETALFAAFRDRHAAPAIARGPGLRALRDWAWAGMAAAAAAVAIVAALQRGPETVATEQAEAESEFVPLPYATGFDDVDAVQVVQVEMSRTALAGLGYTGSLAVGDGAAVRAELLVGNDGVARGIRFVQ